MCRLARLNAYLNRKGPNLPGSIEAVIALYRAILAVSGCEPCTSVSAKKNNEISGIHDYHGGKSRLC